jgi:outer membrane receptor for ferrienterochelin and colicins
MKQVSVRILGLVVLLICNLNATAQSDILFIDEFDDPIVGVKSQYFNSSGTLIFQAISNAEGHVIIPSTKSQLASELTVKAKLFGYKNLDTNIQLESTVKFIMLSDVSEQEEIIVTAQYGQSTVDNSVHRIKVIDREKMDAMGAVNLSNVLTNEMGVRLAQDNVLGSSMSLQGISGENVKILIDGVPVVGRLNGNIDLSQINLSEIERIEIVEGPLSVNYGTNALAGVINLITKKPVRNQISAGVSGYYESIGHYNSNVNVDFGSKNHSFGLAAGRNFFDGWEPSHSTFKNPIPIADERRSVLWNPKEQIFGSAYYQYIKSKWNVRYKFDFFDEYVLNRGLPRQPYYITAFDDEYNTRRIDNTINVKRRFGTYGKLNSIFSYNRYDRLKNTFFVDLTTLDQQLTAAESDQDTSMFDQWLFRGSYMQNNDSAIISYQIGYEVLIESALGRRILDRRQQQGDFALFSTAEIRAGKKWVFRPGLRYAFNTTYTAPVLPSLNIKWNVLKNFDFRASYARGFRAPGIKELYFEFVDINHNIVGNDELNAESSHNLSSAFLYQLKKKKWDISSELMGFYNNISNRISLAAIDATQFSYVNIGSFQSTGTRLSLQFQKDQLQVNTALGWIGTSSNVLSEDLKDDFLFYPEVQGSVMYAILKSKTSFGIFYKYQGALPRFIFDDDGNVTLGIIDGYHTMDVSVSQKIWKEAFNFTLGVKNLFDVTNINTTAGGSGGAHSLGSSSLSIGAGRTYFAALQYRIKQTTKAKK